MNAIASILTQDEAKACRRRVPDGYRVQLPISHIEPWLPVPGSPTAAEAVARLESQGWSVTARRRDVFYATSPTAEETYTFLMLNDRLHRRRQYPRDYPRSGQGGSGEFLCESCRAWHPEAKRVRVLVGSGPGSMFQHSICLECDRGGALQQTRALGYHAVYEREPIRV